MSYLIYKRYCEGRGWAMICVESKKLGFWWAGSHPVHQRYWNPNSKSCPRYVADTLSDLNYAILSI